MPNLKDIRSRINSVKTTRQVTSAMKMVSAAKLKKAQDNITFIRPYVEKIADILVNLTSSLDENVSFDLAEEREPKNILVIVITSNRGLCGAFNTNVVKEVVTNLKTTYSSQLASQSIDIMTIGKQGQKLLKSKGLIASREYNDLFNELNFTNASEISGEILKEYSEKKYDKVLLAYNEFVNAASQNIRFDQFLPIKLLDSTESSASNTDYILEPDKMNIIENLIPKALKTIFYKVLLESVASEHGARMTSMHKATDNATDLLGELNLSYNKARQTSITNEILEIVGGAEALKK